MRPVALGRKNWLHVGSVEAGPKVAAIISVVESCRRLGLSVKDYLSASRRSAPARQDPQLPGRGGHALPAQSVAVPPSP